MFNSVILNVVIGLALVFLLYSLLTSIIGELFASFVGSRGRMLRAAIRRMLEDETAFTGTDFFSDLLQVGKAWLERQQTTLAYFIPLQVRDLWQTKPNTTADAATEAETPAEAAVHLVEKALLDRFYDSPKIKYLAQGSFHSKPSYISAATFSEVLTDVLTGSAAVVSRMDAIGQSLTLNQLNISPATREQLLSYYTQAGGDIEKLKAKLESWFEEMMVRTSGWYKRRSQVVALVIGFFVAVAFNVNTIEIAGKLAMDPKARDGLVAMAESLSKDSQFKKYVQTAQADSLLRDSVILSNFHKIDSLSNRASDIIGLGWNFSQQSKHDVCTINKVDDSLKFAMLAASMLKCDSLNGIVEKEISADSLNRAALNDSLKKTTDTTARTAIQKSIDGLMRTMKAGKHAVTSNIAHRDSILTAATKYSFLSPINVKLTSSSITLDGNRWLSSYWDKIWFVLGNAFSGRQILGFLLTMMAISLGAPFWFDMLNKVVQLRGAGGNPSIQKPGVQQAAPVMPSAAARPGSDKEVG